MADDKYFECVKEALFKDGWTITHDNRHPYTANVPGLLIIGDLGAERILVEFESEGKERILVEIKSFLSKSFNEDFYPALGQILSYTYVLGKKDPGRKVWLAVPEKVYQKHFTTIAIMEITTLHKISVFTYDTTINRIIRWIPK